jgi:probable phosphoglycerate mutase
MLTRILLVRHGATPLAVGDRFAGATDAPLSDEGQAQAERLARRLADEQIDAVYSSPLRRAVATAKAAIGGRTLPIQQYQELREVDHGRWEGLTSDEVKARYSEEFARWSSDPFRNGPQGGETGEQVLTRALPRLERIVCCHEGEHVLVVSHKATIRLLAAAVLGIDPARYRDRLSLEFASLSILTFEAWGRGRLTLWNEVPE